MIHLFGALYLVLVLLALGLGGLAGRRAAERRREAIQSEAWDNGFTHGVRTAVRAVQTYRKPWITFGEERGWDMAREQLRDAVAALLVEDEESAA